MSGRAFVLHCIAVAGKVSMARLISAGLELRGCRQGMGKANGVRRSRPSIRMRPADEGGDGYDVATVIDMRADIEIVPVSQRLATGRAKGREAGAVSLEARLHGFSRNKEIRKSTPSRRLAEAAAAVLSGSSRRRRKVGSPGRDEVKRLLEVVPPRAVQLTPAFPLFSFSEHWAARLPRPAAFSVMSTASGDGAVTCAMLSETRGGAHRENSKIKKNKMLGLRSERCKANIPCSNGLSPLKKGRP